MWLTDYNGVGWFIFCILFLFLTMKRRWDVAFWDHWVLPFLVLDFLFSWLNRRQEHYGVLEAVAGCYFMKQLKRNKRIFCSLIMLSILSWTRWGFWHEFFFCCGLLIGNFEFLLTYNFVLLCLRRYNLNIQDLFGLLFYSCILLTGKDVQTTLGQSFFVNLFIAWYNYIGFI